MTATNTTMTPPATLADGHAFTSALSNPPRVECSATTDPEAINAAMEAAWGQGARVELASEGRVRFLNCYGDGDMARAAFLFVTGYLAATR
jgi:hypothetical protein